MRTTDLKAPKVGYDNKSC